LYLLEKRYGYWNKIYQNSLGNNNSANIYMLEIKKEYNKIIKNQKGNKNEV